MRLTLRFFLTTIVVAGIAAVYRTALFELFEYGLTKLTATYATNTDVDIDIDIDTAHQSMTTALKSALTKLPPSLKPASTTTSTMKLTPRRSAARGHGNHGWLDSYHTFSFADYHDPRFMNWGALRVLNEDRVAPHTGFPTHPHRDAEIFSYILRGALTHRDSMGGGRGKDDFARMTRGDVQFTTGGRGIAHSERNEDEEEVHFLQIWALPWARGLTPRYHTRRFEEAEKKIGFVPIISPLKAGPGASEAEEEKAVPAIEGTIPVHADLVMGAGIVPPGTSWRWWVGGSEGGEAVREKEGRHVYLHLPMTMGGRARVRVGEEVLLEEGDGVFVEGARVGEGISVESVGEVEAEVVVLDSE